MNSMQTHTLQNPQYVNGNMATPATVIPASSDGSRKELSQARLRRRLSSRREQLGYSRLHRELGVQQRSARDREEGNTVTDTSALTY